MGGVFSEDGDAAMALTQLMWAHDAYNYGKPRRLTINDVAINITYKTSLKADKEVGG